jgi:phthalate 4,5-dioxygenase oxygenase subunit
VLTQEQNDLITQTGPGTPGGALMRRYWQPVALAEELPVGGAPIPVRILSEDLVLYRGESGAIGLIGLHCPHRGADLSYGRIEGDALRCLYHGWLMGKDGKCLEQPGESAATSYKSRVKHPGYPCREAGGMILTYMGPDEAPALPKLPLFTDPVERSWATKFFHECNYLQGNEGNIDPQHLSVLHRIAPPEAANERGRRNQMMLGTDLAPKIDVEETNYGLRISASRLVGNGEKYVRVSNFVMPNASAFDGGPLQDPKKIAPRDNGYWFHWHVPVDDTHHWKYAVGYCYDEAVDIDYMKRVVLADVGENYTLVRNQRNRYLQDREEMKSRTWLGMGLNFRDHDRFAVESQRAISDRTREHLGTSDRAIILMRRQLLQAIEDIRQGRDPRMIARDPAADPVKDLVVVSRRVPEDHDAMLVWREFRPSPRAAAE